MDSRYRATYADIIFDENTKIQRWFNWTKRFAEDAIVQANPPNKDVIIQGLDRMMVPTAMDVQTREHQTRHDVVAFLSLVEESAPSVCLPYIHYGLTSSDLVENAHHDALREHVTAMLRYLSTLNRAMTNLATHTRAPRPGRTHGQIADVTSFEWQMHVHSDVVSRLMRGLNYWPGRAHVDALYKSPGPTGESPFRQRIEGSVPSTQVIPRDYQIEWASLYLRIAVEMEAIATLIRCGARSEIGELAEGASSGSSAMPHKANPVSCEKVCGMARLARGYFMAIAETGALWDDRDISNSSVERVAVVDLAATVEHMVTTMVAVIHDLYVDVELMALNASDPRTASSILQTLAQKHFALGPVAASQFVKDNIVFASRGNQAFTFRPRSEEEFDGPLTQSVVAWMDEAQDVWERVRA